MSQAASEAISSANATYSGGDAISGTGQSKWIIFALIGGAVLLAYLFLKKKGGK
jgi:LPXTG-motif cell wall-anchored protein